MALNWGAREEYPEFVVANWSLWQRWLEQENYKKHYVIRHRGSKGSKLKRLQERRKNVRNID